MDSLYVWCMDTLKQAINLVNLCRRMRRLYYGSIGVLTVGLLSSAALYQRTSCFFFWMGLIGVVFGFVLMVQLQKKYKSVCRQLDSIGPEIEVIREIAGVGERKDWNKIEVKALKHRLGQLPIFQSQQ